MRQTPGAVSGAPLFELAVAALLVDQVEPSWVELLVKPELVVDPLVVISVTTIAAGSVVLVVEALRVVAAAAL